MNAELNGCTIHFADEGPRDADPLILIHGFPLSHQMWKPQIDALSDRWRIVAPDVRGFGESAAGDGQYALEVFVDDLIALMDHLELKSATLCGLSMGGYIALRTAERNPERVKRLILCDTRSESDGNEARLARGKAIRAIKTSGVPAFAESFIPMAFAPQTISGKPDVIAFSRKLMESNSEVGLSGALLAMATRTDTTASLSKIRVPTLFLVGSEDKMTPASASAAMCSHVSHGEMRVIPDAGHMSNLENPEEFNAHIGRFLSKPSG